MIKYRSHFRKDLGSFPKISIKGILEIHILMKLPMLLSVIMYDEEESISILRRNRTGKVGIDLHELYISQIILQE